LLPPLVSPVPSTPPLSRVGSAPNFYRSRGHWGAGSPPGALAAEWSRQLPPGTDSEAAAIVCAHLSKVNACLRDAEPQRLEEALRAASGNQYLRTISALRRSRSVSGLQRHALEAALASHMVKARTILSDWKPGVEKDDTAKRRPRKGRDPPANADATPKKHAKETGQASLRKAMQKGDAAAVRRALKEKGESITPGLKDEARGLLKRYDERSRALSDAIDSRNKEAIEQALQAWDFDTEDELAKEARDFLSQPENLQAAPQFEGADVPSSGSKSAASDPDVRAVSRESVRASEPQSQLETAAVAKQELTGETSHDIKEVPAVGDHRSFADIPREGEDPAASSCKDATYPEAPPDSHFREVPALPPRDARDLGDVDQNTAVKSAAPLPIVAEEFSTGPSSDFAASDPPHASAQEKGLDPDVAPVHSHLQAGAADEFEASTAGGEGSLIPGDEEDGFEPDTADAPQSEAKGPTDAAAEAEYGFELDTTKDKLEIADDHVSHDRAMPASETHGDLGMEIDQSAAARTGDQHAGKVDDEFDAKSEQVASDVQPDAANAGVTVQEEGCDAGSPDGGGASQDTPMASRALEVDAVAKDEQQCAELPKGGEGSPVVEPACQPQPEDGAPDAAGVAQDDGDEKAAAAAEEADGHGAKAAGVSPGHRRSVTFDASPAEQVAVERFEEEPQGQPELGQRDYTMTFEDEPQSQPKLGARDYTMSFEQEEPADQPSLGQRDYTMAFEDEPESQPKVGLRDYTMSFEQEPEEAAGAAGQDGRGDEYEEFGFEPETPQTQDKVRFGDREGYGDEGEGFENESDAFEGFEEKKETGE